MEQYESTILKVLSIHYGILNPTIKRMEGYESNNFKIESGEKCFVLKIYDSTASNKSFLQGENQILKELENLADYDFPRPIQSREGNVLVESNDKIFRLLTFLNGKFLGNVTRSKTLARELGVLLGKMNQITVSLYNDAITSRQTHWDLQYLSKNEKFIKYIPKPKDRSLVEYFLLQFKENVVPIQEELRKGIIYNDANEWNVLTQNKSISGLIDFGDMSHTWIINELAVALTYYMMEKENPLDFAVPLIEGYNSIISLEVEELDILYYLIAGRLCTSVCNSAYSKTQNPDSSYITISEKQAWNLLYKWVTINPIKARNIFRKAAGLSPIKKKEPQELIELRNKYVSSSLSLSYDKPIYMKQSAFQYMYDNQGNTFLDAYNNIMLVGHSHPKVVSAGQRALAKLNTNTRYLYDELTSYSEKLLSKFPSELCKVFFVNSGSAASDLAIRLAQSHTRKNKIMVMEHGYHGNTRLGIDISHYKYGHKEGTGKREYIIQTQMPKIFNSGFDMEKGCQHFVSKTLKDIENHRNQIGAFIAEPIIGCGGQVPLPKKYLKKIYPAIREQGGVCISDEVQVGFGRLGKYFWGFEMYGVIPDIVVIGKPMGNGHPIGAVVTTNEIAKSFETGPEFFSSFGGNPVSCSIGEAVLDVIQEEKLQKNARNTGKYLKNLLQTLGEKFPEIADVRGEGLFLGIEIHNENDQPNKVLANYLKNGLRERNILVSTDGPYDNVLKIKPPLYFNEENCNTLVSTMEILLRKK